MESTLDIETLTKESDVNFYLHPYSANKEERKALQKYPIPLEALAPFISEDEKKDLFEIRERVNKENSDFPDTIWRYNVEFNIQKEFSISFKGKTFLCKSIRYYQNVDGPKNIKIKDVFSKIDFTKAICAIATPENKTGDLKRRITAFAPYFCGGFFIGVVGCAYFTVSDDFSKITLDGPGNGYINSLVDPSNGDYILTLEQAKDIEKLIYSQPNPIEVIERISNCGDSTFCIGDETLKIKYEKPEITSSIVHEVVSLPSEFKKIESLDDPTLYEYLEHHPNINEMYVLIFVFLILYLLIINQRSFKF